MRIYYPDAPDLPEPGQAPAVFRSDQIDAIKQMTNAVKRGVVVKGIKEPYHSALVGAGMGSGKTTLSVETILNTNPFRCLIVGVRDAYNQWESTLLEQQVAEVKRPLLRINNTAKGKENLARLLDGTKEGIYYIGLEMLRAQDWVTVSRNQPTNPALIELFGDAIQPIHVVKEKKHLRTYADMPELDLLISDESHKHSAQKSSAIQTMRTIPTKAKIALSGTFFGNKFENAWSLTTWLWGREVIGSKGAWEQRWVEKKPVMSKDGRTQLKSRNGFPLTKITGERIPGEFVKTLPCYVFVATPIGPPPEPEIVKIDLHPEQQRQYEEMEAESITWIPTKQGSQAPLIADLPLVQRIRLRTAALGGMTLVPGEADDDPDSIIFEPGSPSSTLTALHGVLHRPDWAGQKCLILTHSRQFAIEAARRIGRKYRVGLKTGDTTSEQWDKDKASFMLDINEHPDSVQYIVAVISAVGTATDGLQRSASKVVWLSEDDSNVNNLQASNRIWRQGVDLDSYAAVKIVQRGTIAEGVLLKNDAHRVHTMQSITK